MNASVTMHVAVKEYLSSRRKLGFDLRIEGEELGRFARFADQIGHTGPLTVELAVQWATLPADAERLYHARRLDMVRRLARHMAVFEPATEIPPVGLLGSSYSWARRSPFPHWSSPWRRSSASCPTGSATEPRRSASAWPSAPALWKS